MIDLTDGNDEQHYNRRTKNTNDNTRSTNKKLLKTQIYCVIEQYTVL